VGIFSTEKTPKVASVSYNLGGPDEDLPDYMRMTILSNTFRSENVSMSSAITNNYLNGPGIKVRNFYNWCLQNYPNADMPRDSYTSSRELNQNSALRAITEEVGGTVKLSWLEMDKADIVYWGMRWMLANMPERMDDDWVVELEDGMMTIVFDDEETEPIDIAVPSDFDPSKRYIYARYVTSGSMTSNPVVTGTVIPIAPADPFPSTDGWQAMSSSLTPFTQEIRTITKTTKSYSDGRPDEITTSTVTAVAEWERFYGVWMKVIYNGMAPDGSRTSTRSYMNLVQDRVLEVTESSETSSETVAGVTVTTRVNVTEDNLVLQKSVRYDEQTLNLVTWSNPAIFIYGQGSGDAELDAVFTEYDLGNGYYPIMPLRIKRNTLSDEYEPELYAQTSRAYKKIFNQSFIEIMRTVKDNPNLEEIDYAYVIFGVNLNTKQNSARRYLFDYFARLMSQTPTDLSTDAESWEQTIYADYENQSSSYADWLAEQQDIGSGASEADFSNEPELPTYQAQPAGRVQIKSNSAKINFEFVLEWTSMRHTRGSGKAKPEAKTGDCWIETGAAANYSYVDVLSGETAVSKKTAVVFTLQETDQSWRRITVTGLRHRNYVYGGKATNVWAVDALTDEDETGFIVPLHYDVYKKMPLKEATQMAGTCAHIIFNSYVIVKRQWYQRGAFKVIMFIIAVIITIYYPPAGFVAFATLLGVNIVLAAIIWVALSYLVAMVLTKITMAASTAMFGEKVGRIIGAIASFIAVAYAGSVVNTGSFTAFDWSSLLSAQSMLSMTSAIGNGIADLMLMEAQDYAKQAAKVQDDYQDKIEDLEQRYKDVLGDGVSYIDAMSLTQAAGYRFEPSETFLSRTLLTGSDMAELTTGLITSFTDITLRTDLPE
jgi:hypothetical protein